MAVASGRWCTSLALMTRSVYVVAPDVDIAAIQDEIDFSASMDDILVSVYANDLNLAWVYLGTESGLARIYPWTSGLPAGYDPRRRGWYKSVAEANGLVWSELYVDAGGRGLMVTCSSPVYRDDGEMIGVVAADVTLDTINDRVINTQIGKRGYAFLIDTAGRVVARPGLTEGDIRWDESFATENLLLDSDGDLKAVVERMVAGESVTEAVTRKNEQFGPERLARIIQENPDLSAQELIDRIQSEVLSFSEGQAQFDDLTLMIMKIS